jgi:ABC-type multidrug transport system ATPase subunit
LLHLFDNIILISDGNVIEQGKASMLLQNRESKTSIFIQNFEEDWVVKGTRAEDLDDRTEGKPQFRR